MAHWPWKGGPLPLFLFSVNPLFEKSPLLQQSNYLHCPHKIEVETAERGGRGDDGILQPVGNKIFPSLEMFHRLLLDLCGGHRRHLDPRADDPAAPSSLPLCDGLRDKSTVALSVLGARK